MTIRPLWAALGAVPLLLAQPGANVTDHMRIRIDGKVQIGRKINGRWWSTDNRELRQTSTGWLWTVSGGNARHLVRFDHHFPFDPNKVASLTRAMGPNDVRGVLGEPNSVFPSDKPEQEQAWEYYAANGYMLRIHFGATNPGIFTAHYEPDPSSMPKDVPHLAFRFNGKTAQEMFEERKANKASQPPVMRGSSTAEIRGRLMAERGRTNSMTGIARSGGGVPVAQAAPAPPSRKVTAAETGAVVTGMERGKLIELLGEPASRMAITTDEGTRETLRYELDAGGMVTIVVMAGKVAEAPR